MRAALAHRDFRLLLSGQAISDTGNWLYNVALIVYVLDQTHSAGWVAATTIARFLPIVVLGPFGGAIADRYDRKRVMIVCDLGRAVVMFGLTGLAAAEGPALAAVLLAGVSVIFSVPYVPSVYASVPALAGEDDLTAANALVATIDNVTLVLGPALGGILIALGSPAAAFLVNALTFLASLGLTVPIRTKLSVGASVDGVDEERPRSLGTRVADGLRSITSSADVLLVVLVGVAFTTFYGQELVLYSLAATQRLGLGNEGVGYLLAATGIGGILAAGLVARFGERSRQGVLLAGSLVVAAIPIIALSIVTTPGVAYALLLIEGVGFVVGDVVTTTMLQRILAPEVMGRVFGIVDSLAVSGIVVGSLIAPLVVRAFGLEVALVVAGTLLAGTGLLVLPRARSLDRRARARFEELAPRVEVLQRAGLFEAAPRQILEGLAAAATTIHVEAGTTVVREGDAPDALYVIVGGEVTVAASGEAGGAPRDLGRVGAGGYFGEIGLLEGIPRTATVTAVEPTELLRIAGDDFMRMANEGVGVSGALKAGMSRRLGLTHPSRLQSGTESG